MTPLRFEEARRCVLETVRAATATPAFEMVPLAEASGRVLAYRMHADRDYPPVARSIRDGFALRAADAVGPLRVVGEVRAGEAYSGSVKPGETVEIMTGAPLPPGADAVTMVEHVVRDGNSISVGRPVAVGDFILERGAEVRAGGPVLDVGIRLDFAHVGMLATVGYASVPVYKRARVCILATGDEVVGVEHPPESYQVRNSNSYSVSAQVKDAGGIPDVLPVAPDDYVTTRVLIEAGLESDLLLLSGGVSAGKYDIVEKVLADIGAEFYFDRVLIQPGQPLVFARVGTTFVFGLPGNPASTMVTFAVLARAALDLLNGVLTPVLGLQLARLMKGFRHKKGLTRFIPAYVREGQVEPVAWQGSSDVPALARANSFLVARDDREVWESGETIEVLVR